MYSVLQRHEIIPLGVNLYKTDARHWYQEAFQSQKYLNSLNVSRLNEKNLSSTNPLLYAPQQQLLQP